MFQAWLRALVTITASGSRATDFARANKAAGLPSTPEGHTWHRHQDGQTIQLAPRDLHANTGHTGALL
ncbi:MAG: HNH endonuclease [Rhizobiales bacterium]|nr:HNH endonuclease [Hyphomicrobiales bacterium]